MERLVLVLEHMPDEGLMRELEARRGKGRNEHPVRGMWNSLLAGIVFGHDSVESLRAELSRNAQLRELCGLAFAREQLLLHGSRCFKGLRFALHLLPALRELRFEPPQIRPQAILPAPESLRRQFMQQG